MFGNYSSVVTWLSMATRRPLVALRSTHGDSPATISLAGTYHNLLRMWADT